MQTSTYSIDDLTFAYCCHVYIRWHTHYRQAIPILHQLESSQLEAIHPEVHVLELAASPKEVVVLASLNPKESVSSAASKLKGATSKVIRNMLKKSSADRLLGNGYYAETTGNSTTKILESYLDQQSEHHGYAGRDLPPVFVKEWELTDADLRRLQAKSAHTLLRWHVVLSTWNRVGTFTTDAGQAICDCWSRECPEWKVRLRKVSVVPDHIHTTAWSHPSVAPADTVVQMLNSSQRLMCDQFEQLLVAGGQPQLWKPGAYIGSYGDVSKSNIRNYVRQLSNS